MTRDDIIRMAREAGLFVPQAGIPENGALMRFASLVAAAERKACAKVCEDKAKQTFSGQCAVWGDYFARAIRARGAQPATLSYPCGSLGEQHDEN